MSGGDRDLQQMKADAMAFYDLMFNRCDPRGAIERYVGATYRQHNPEDGKIVEHWDVLQVIPETAANDNTMF